MKHLISITCIIAALFLISCEEEEQKTEIPGIHDVVSENEAELVEQAKKHYAFDSKGALGIQIGSENPLVPQGMQFNDERIDVPAGEGDAYTYLKTSVIKDGKVMITFKRADTESPVTEINVISEEIVDKKGLGPKAAMKVLQNRYPTGKFYYTYVSDRLFFQSDIAVGGPQFIFDSSADITNTPVKSDLEERTLDQLNTAMLVEKVRIY